MSGTLIVRITGDVGTLIVRITGDIGTLIVRITDDVRDFNRSYHWRCPGF